MDRSRKTRGGREKLENNGQKFFQDFQSFGISSYGLQNDIECVLKREGVRMRNGFIRRILLLDQDAV